MIELGDLAAAIQKATRTFDAREAELNAADGKLGDGDTGTMLKRLTARLAETDLPAGMPLTDAFRVLAMAASAATGSSLGTLIMTALMSCSRSAAGKSALATSDLAAMIEAASDAMSKRGGANPGDKTVLDSLLAIASALAGTSPDTALAACRGVARSALDRFRDQPSKLGRAGRYGEGSRGLDDPGMLAVAMLCDGL